MMDFDPRYTEVITDHNNIHGYILRDTRTGKTKRVKGVTGHIHNVFSKGKERKPDIATTTFSEAAIKRGISIHGEISSWIDSPRIFNKMSLDAQTGVSMLVSQFPPLQGWTYHHDVPVTDYKKFASEIDVLVRNEHTGETHIIDLKTGSWRGGEYSAQLSFYKRMYELGHPDEKISGIWGLRTKEGSRGFVKAQEFTKAEVDSIFYKGVRPVKYHNMNRGTAAPKSNVLDHFEPAARQSGSGVSRPVTFFDVETGPRGEILQIGAVKGVFNKKAGQFQIIDKFTRHFTGDPSTYNTQEWALLQETHGITPENAALRGKKYGRWGERHLNAFKQFVGDSVLAGHNIEEFDIPSVFGKDTPGNDIIDTLHIARNIRGQGGNKLGELFALTTGVSMKRAGFLAHDALGDVMANAKMFEGWLNRGGSPFQEYSNLVLDNPGLSTIRKNTYTGAMVRMKDEELTPEDLLSMNIGTGMSIEDLSDMLDEERSARLDRGAPPKGFVSASGGPDWSGLDVAEIKALLNRQAHLTGSLGEFTQSLSTSVYNHQAQIRNNMLRSMVDYTDDDARSILQRMYGDAEVERNIDTIKTMRKAKYRGWALHEIEKAAARGFDITNMPEFADLNLVARGADTSFTLDPQTGAAINTPLDGRQTVLDARVKMKELFGAQGAISKGHALARYADYHGLHARAAELRMVRDDDQFFQTSMAYNEDRRKQHEAELLSKKKGEAVREMLYTGHQSGAAQAAALAKSEDELWRARQMGKKELEDYTKKVSAFQDMMKSFIEMPGQVGAGHQELIAKGRGMAHNVWQASSGFVPREFQGAGSHFIDSAFDMYGAGVVGKNTNLQIGSNLVGAAFTGAASLAGLGPIGMAAGGVGGLLSQLIPSFFKKKEANMAENMGFIAGKANFWSGMVELITGPFKMLARVTKDLTRGFLGLSAGIAGILIGGLNRLDTAKEHYASLTGLSHMAYQQTYTVDAWLGLKEGSLASEGENVLQSMRAFLTSGEGAPKWANLALSGSLSRYLSMGSYDGYMAMINDVAKQGFDDPSRQQDIMANLQAAFGKGATTQTVQAMWTHGITDAKQIGRGALNSIYGIDLNNDWQLRVNNTRAEWGRTAHGFDNAWMKMTVNMWDALGRDISNSVLRVMDAFGEHGLTGGLEALRKEAKALWTAFKSNEGIGGTGINLESVKNVGKQLLATLLEGGAEVIRIMSPAVIKGFQDIMSSIMDVIASVAGRLEGLFALMSTFQINPKVFESLALISSGGVDAAKGWLMFKEAQAEGFITSANLSYINGRVAKKNDDIDNVKFGSRMNLGSYALNNALFNHLREAEKSGDAISNESVWNALKNAPSTEPIEYINMPDGSSVSVREIEEAYRIASGEVRVMPGGTVVSDEVRKYYTDKFNNMIGSVRYYGQEIYSHNRNNWALHNGAERMGFRNKADEHAMLEDSIRNATEGTVSAAGMMANVIGDGAASILEAGAERLRASMEVTVKEDRTEVSFTDAYGEAKKAVLKTGQKFSDILNLNYSSAAAEGVH